MMRHVVDLHLPHVLRELRVMKRIVHHVVEDVEGERTGNDTVCHPIGEQCMGELAEGVGEGREECRWHD